MENSNRNLEYRTVWFDGNGWQTSKSSRIVPLSDVKSIVGREFDRERFELTLWGGKCILIDGSFTTVECNE